MTRLRPGRKMLRFLKEGDPIVFQRNTDHVCLWEPGAYIEADRAPDPSGNAAGNRNGWHRVRDANGGRHYIPTRRLARPQDKP